MISNHAAGKLWNRTATAGSSKISLVANRSKLNRGHPAGKTRSWKDRSHGARAAASLRPRKASTRVVFIAEMLAFHHHLWKTATTLDLATDRGRKILSEAELAQPVQPEGDMQTQNQTGRILCVREATGRGAAQTFPQKAPHFSRLSVALRNAQMGLLCGMTCVGL